jgi:hypothetical protein
MRLTFIILPILGLTILSCSKAKKEFKVIEHSTFTWSSIEPSEVWPGGGSESLLPLPLHEADTSTNTLPISAFIQNGELWLCDSTSFTKELVTQTNGAIHSFAFSPNRKYLASLRYVGTQTGMGDSVYNLLIIKVIQKSVKEFRSDAKYLDFISWQNWISKSRGMFRLVDGLTMGSCFVYDAYRDTLQYTRYDFFGDDESK